MDDAQRDRIIQRAFISHCGPDVVYVEQTIGRNRELSIRYRIPSLDEERSFVVRGMPKNGLSDALWSVATRAGTSARRHAYHATGEARRDMKQLLQGKLIDEHPRSNAQAAEVSPAVAVDPEP